jgi:2'-5' RNA ligase
VRWAPRSFELGYVILLSDQVANYVRGLQIELPRKHGSYPSLHVTPHITLKQAFPVAALEPFERYFEQLACETKPFEIVVRGFGFFSEGVIFLDVVQSGELVPCRVSS